MLARRSQSPFAALLRRHRIAAGLTQEMLAEQASLSARAISDLERGVHQGPQQATVQLLVQALKLSAQDAAVFESAANRKRSGTAFRASLERPSRIAPGYVPVPLSRFIGREDEIADLALRLPTCRLMTLTGTGGVGKTRLALEAASRTPGEKRFIDLGAVVDDRLAPAAVAAALGVREEPDRSLVDTLIDALSESDVLIILDNCEHLLEACARLSKDLLQGCPQLRILATSRQVLGLEGEIEWSVKPLPVPGPADSDSESTVLASPAVQLCNSSKKNTAIWS